ncbi:MAG: FAD-dependent oxidoreductase [Phenylobacterium sp.]|uniref:FAD-dependent oxidoreductase n=1 Tax=Phenylobacterium sp. TaxID=1871053 RepID=UPI00120AE163|nr:FAD-dependent oxidoreductase [Phenylobacterium sp.]TAJ72436.1 MAG: FAD-dependent oxidoreductase [Phenylobacterium sp.]
MKVAVLGGGVVGVTSAYYLAKAGYEGALIDRQAGLARRSYSAGLLAPPQYWPRSKFSWPAPEATSPSC